MNPQDNFIQEAVANIILRLKKRFDTDNVWKSDDGTTAYLAIGNLWEAIDEELTQSLEAQKFHIKETLMAGMAGERRSMTYQMWATTKDGDGMVQSLGVYEDIESVRIQCGMFSDDVVITIEEHHKPEDEKL